MGALGGWRGRTGHRRDERPEKILCGHTRRHAETHPLESCVGITDGERVVDLPFCLEVRFQNGDWVQKIKYFEETFFTKEEGTQHPIVRVWLVVAFSLQPPCRPRRGISVGSTPLGANLAWASLTALREISRADWLAGRLAAAGRHISMRPHVFFRLFFLLADTRQAASGATRPQTQKLLEAFCVLKLPFSAMPDSDDNAGMSCIRRPRQQGAELGKRKGVLVRSLRSSTFNHHIISSCPWPSSALLLLQGFVANF